MIIEVRNKKIFYVTEGNTKDPLLFYIHGNLGSTRWFQKVMDIPDYYTVAMDMPNFGNSDSIDEMDIDTYADYTALVLQGVLTDSKKDSAVVAGHSLGGAVGVSLAVRYPELVEKLILIDPPPLEGLVTPKEHYPVIEMYRSDKNLLKTALKTVTPTMDDDLFLDALTDDASKMKGDAFIGHVKSLEHFNYADRVKDYKQPVLVIVGSRDVLITDEMGRKIANSFPAGEYRYVEDTGHSITVEAPDQFIQIVMDFFRCL